MSAVLARLSNLSVAYRADGGSALALDGIDLDIFAGERLAIIGESGSGKSTLALAVSGLLPDTARQSGRIEWPGPTDLSEPVQQKSNLSSRSTPTPDPAGLLPQPSFGPPQGGGGLARPLSSLPLVGRVRGGGAATTEGDASGANSGSFPLPGRDIGFVFQDAGASLNPVLTVGEQIAEVVKRHLGMGWSDAYRHAADLLDRVRIPQTQAALKAYPHQLSGGQRQRVAIASAIAAKPKLLIADEPTSALDMVVQAEIVALLDRLVREDGMTLLFITHDIALASGFADRIAVFRAARLVEAGPTSSVLSNPASAYTRSLIAAHIDLSTPALVAGTA